MKVRVPPIKSQGIKTKLVPWIETTLPNDLRGRWVEPFMGTGVVAFNLAPKQALLCDTNPHVINFYQSLASGDIGPENAKAFLTDEGLKLLQKGESHYYMVRERFNQSHSPLDFLFLNRAGFNGMIRFNRKGQFNIPFCRKPNRFAQAYVTKIANQIEFVCNLLRLRDFEFKCQPFQDSIALARSGDVIYCDPPYIARHADYYNGWDETQEVALHQALIGTNAKFVLSTWHHNDYRVNDFVRSLWGDFFIQTRDHFYHVGANENNRSPMVEALITNFEPSSTAPMGMTAYMKGK